MNENFRLFPRATSVLAGEVDAIFWTLFILCGLMTVAIASTLIYFVVKYYHAPLSKRSITNRQQHAVEYSWSIIPFFIFMAVFLWAGYIYYKMHIAPQNSMEIYVLGKQWMWKFQHANGIREINNLHVPVHTPVKLIMSSEDVIHSLFVPNFRMKQDVVPGRYNYTWFEATETGEFIIFCAQYCGTLHADMIGNVIVMTQDAFQTWQETQLVVQPNGTESGMTVRGRELFYRIGCVFCHGPPYGVKAPDLRGIYMKPVKLTTGNTVIADDDYLRESILNPDAKIVEGYGSTMPSFQGQVTEQEVLDLIAYLKSLKSSEKL